MGREASGGPLGELLIATRNRGKIREFAGFLAGLPIRLRGLAEFSDFPAVEETGETYAENASLKAAAGAVRSGLWALADDSGLEVEALGGAPGVYSARYGGAQASDAERVARLLSEIERAHAARRHARFVCAIAVADPSTGLCEVFTGVCEGRIASAPRGAHGFGYDPVFIPEGFERTFGELAADVKERISHRARAMRAARLYLEERLREGRLASVGTP